MPNQIFPVHEVDDYGKEVHIDVDPFIPTGICAVCTGVESETEAPEDRPAG